MSEAPSKEITVVPRNEISISSMSPSQITHQMKLIRQVMKENMVEKQDYGVIPGTDKPTLYKAGAEKLRLLFNLAPTYNWRTEDLGNGHKEFEFSCTLTQIHTGQVWGEGIGSCSTMEKKYRYRSGVSGGQIENPNIADVYNTVRKMAKKRSFVDAIITVTSASAIFTQDVEDDPDKAGDKASAEPGQTTNLILGPDPEGVQVWRSYVKKIVNKSGVGKTGQPWYMTGLSLPGHEGKFDWVSTFSKELGVRARAFENKTADLTVRPGNKEGSWDLVDISFPKISGVKEAPVVEPQEANGENAELELEEVNPFNDQD